MARTPAPTAASQRYDVCIVGGAGHVGLPLALVFAHKGRRVVIQDIDARALATIARGELPAKEEGAEPLLAAALADGSLSMTTDPAVVARSDAVIVTIGTPVDEFLNPIHKAVRECIDGIVPHLADDALLVMRSTVYPGTTDWLHRYLADMGKRVRLAFCPERVVQGFSVRELQGMPQIVSGTTPEALAAARALFGAISPEAVELSPIEAEFAKLFNNTYRYINFAITNQFYMIATGAGVDYYRVLDAMTRHYPRAADMPRAGFTAGPCLFKDTMQLAAFARNQFSLGHAAMLVNEGIVLYIIDQLRARFALESTTVGLLGMAFKGDSDDVRASLSYKMKKDLAIHAKAVLTTDPFVRTDPDLIPVEDVIARSDVLVLCTPHSAYRTLDTRGKPIVDVWNMTGPGRLPI